MIITPLPNLDTALIRPWSFSTFNISSKASNRVHKGLLDFVEDKDTDG